VIPLTNRLAYLRWRLRRATEDGDPVEVEVVGGQIAEALPPEGDAPRHRFRESQLAWYLPRVDRSRELMGERYAESISLALLASEAGMSPFHFARVFRELAGIPPHRYLLRVRLGRAAQLLREGMSVTEACYASGYSNLSHFIRTFSRAYGAAPSRFAGLR
jgi:AraC-like DNA-binding protein